MKDSGVQWLGEIPSHWDVKRLRHVVQTNPKKSELRFTRSDLEISFLPMPAVGEQGSLDLSQIKHLAEVYESFTYFCDNDVIVAKITPCFENGKGAIVRGLENGIGFGTTELFVLRPGHDTDSEFLYYLTVSSRFRTLGTVSMQGAAGQQRVTDLFIKDYVLGLPPLAEQRAIASYLDHETARIDRLINKTEALNALLREKRVALISQAVTKGLDAGAEMKESGVEWLGEIPAHWDVKRLKFVGESIIGLTYSPTDVTDEANGILVLRASNIQNGRLAFYDAVYVDTKIPKKLFTREDDILICSRSGSRALIGKNAKITGRAVGVSFGAFMTVFRSQYSDYLSYVFDSTLFEQQSSLFMTSTINQLTISILNNIQVSFPPLHEQRAIAEYLDRETARIDALIKKNDELIALLREKRTALISAAVTGKIEVDLTPAPAPPQSIGEGSSVAL